MCKQIFTTRKRALFNLYAHAVEVIRLHLSKKNNRLLKYPCIVTTVPKHLRLSSKYLVSTALNRLFCTEMRSDGFKYCYCFSFWTCFWNQSILRKDLLSNLFFSLEKKSYRECDVCTLLLFEKLKYLVFEHVIWEFFDFIPKLGRKGIFIKIRN